MSITGCSTSTFRVDVMRNTDYEEFGMSHDFVREATVPDHS